MSPLDTPIGATRVRAGCPLVAGHCLRWRSYIRWNRRLASSTLSITLRSSVCSPLPSAPPHLPPNLVSAFWRTGASWSASTKALSLSARTWSWARCARPYVRRIRSTCDRHWARRRTLVRPASPEGLVLAVRSYRTSESVYVRDRHWSGITLILSARLIPSARLFVVYCAPHLLGRRLPLA